MTSLRKTVNLRPADVPVLEPFLRDDGDEADALAEAMGERPGSDAAQLRGLALVGAKHLRDELERRRYDEAVASGAFVESDRSLAEGRRRRRPSSAA